MTSFPGYFHWFCLDPKSPEVSGSLSITCDWLGLGSILIMLFSSAIIFQEAERQLDKVGESRQGLEIAASE